MGININTIKVFNLLNKEEVNFGDVINLGRQRLYLKPSRLLKELKKTNINENKINNFNSLLPIDYADDLIKLYGAKKIDSIDYSDYEGAKIVWDLNTPIPEKLKHNYDLVIDGGTLEHVFNFPMAIKNSIDMIKPGGNFTSITCCNNLAGHGFYQFSPELFFKIFSRKNGFEKCDIFIAINNRLETKSIWYKVKSPDEVKDRVTFRNYRKTEIIVIARRSKEEKFSFNPSGIYQSDYIRSWDSKETLNSKKLKRCILKKCLSFLKVKSKNLLLNGSPNFNYKFFNKFYYRHYK